MEEQGEMKRNLPQNGEINKLKLHTPPMIFKFENQYDYTKKSQTNQHLQNIPSSIIQSPHTKNGQEDGF